MLRLEYATTAPAAVEDHGAGAPVIAGGGGYGLTGMRERAELLGGHSTPGPTDDGFKVELWVPTE